MNTLPKLKDVDGINKLIDGAVKASAKAHDMRHEAAVQALMHFEKHGDTSLIVRLLDLLRSCPGVLVPAYVKWFKDYAPVKLAVEGGAVVATKDTSPEAKPFRVESANSAPAEQTAEARAALAKPLPEFSANFFRSRIASLRTGLEKARDGKVDRTIAGDPAILEAALVAALAAFDANIKPVAVDNGAVAVARAA